MCKINAKTSLQMFYFTCNHGLTVSVLQCVIQQSNSWFIIISMAAGDFETTILILNYLYTYFVVFVQFVGHRFCSLSC